MADDRYPRGSDPRDDYYNRSEVQDYGRDYGSGRQGGQSSAREYQAAGDSGDDRYGRREYGNQRYGQREQMSRGQDYGLRDQGFGQDRDSGYYQGERSDYRGSYGSDGRRFENYGRDADSDRGRDRSRGDYDRSSQSRGQDRDDRGFMARAGDEVRSWFGDEDAERRREMDARRDEHDFNYRYDNDRDSDYHQWRRGQIEALDRDYHEYRQHNRSKFSDEFATWRTGRQSQRDLLKQVAEHMDVVGSDGEHVGTVDKVDGDHIKLTRNDPDAGGHHHNIPSSWLASVDSRITLSRTAAEAKAAWQEVGEQEQRRDGASGSQGGQQDGQRGTQVRDSQGRVLNRSFSGTY